MSKIGWIIAIAALAAVTFALDGGCRFGWDAGFCVLDRATIAPSIHDTGEFMLTEVVSLAVCLIGLVIAYIAYVDGDARGVRLAALFILLFAISLISENNLMRDDVRPQFVLVLLIWISIEFLIARSPAAIALLVLGVLVAALGQLGDHTTEVQFENFFGMSIADSPLAGIARTFGALEEPLEMAGWLLFVVGAVVGLDIRPIPHHRARFLGLMLVGGLAIVVGNTYLHVPDDHPHQALRKFGLFCSVAGVALASIALLLRHARQGALAQAYCALFIVAAYWIGAYAPTIYVHEHSKTISSWVWIFPVLTGYYALVRFRRSYGEPDTHHAYRSTESRLDW